VLQKSSSNWNYKHHNCFKLKIHQNTTNSYFLLMFRSLSSLNLYLSLYLSLISGCVLMIL